jgi:hypothetical protein
MSAASTGVYRDAKSWTVLWRTSPLPAPPRFQYVCWARFTGVALFSAVAFICTLRTYGLERWYVTYTSRSPGNPASDTHREVRFIAFHALQVSKYIYFKYLQMFVCFFSCLPRHRCPTTTQRGHGQWVCITNYKGKNKHQTLVRKKNKPVTKQSDLLLCHIIQDHIEHLRYTMIPVI